MKFSELNCLYLDARFADKRRHALKCSRMKKHRKGSQTPYEICQFKATWFLVMLLHSYCTTTIEAVKTPVSLTVFHFSLPVF